MWRAGWAGADGREEAGWQMSRWLSPEPEQWNQPGFPDIPPSSFPSLLSSAPVAAPSEEVRDSLRNFDGGGG